MKFGWINLFCGIIVLLLRHWLLVGFALLFAVGHVYVTAINIRSEAMT